MNKKNNRHIHFAATSLNEEVLNKLDTTIFGLDEKTININRNKYGNNTIRKEKNNSLLKKITKAFINPFSLILFVLAFISSLTDMVFPYFSMFGCKREDFNPITASIILVMVFVSGILRFFSRI